MWQVIRKNKIKSVWLIILMALMLSILGAAIGSYLFTDNPQEGIFAGIFVAMVVWIVMLLIGFSSGPCPTSVNFFD